MPTCPTCGQVLMADHTCDQLAATRGELRGAAEDWKAAVAFELDARTEVHRLAVQLVYLGATKAEACRLAGVSRPTLDKLLIAEQERRDAARREAQQ